MTAARPSTTYPFVTRRQVLERLDRDPEFVRECIALLHRRFVDRDLLSPPAGWMSSQRKAGEEVYARLSGEFVNAADVVIGAAIAKRYAKQLCKVFRDEQLAQNPTLATAAAIFGVRAPVDDEPLDTADDPYSELDEAREDETVAIKPGFEDAAFESATSATRAHVHDPDGAVPSVTTPDPAPEKRRPGRPKGSKNRHKEDPRKKSTKRARRS